MMFLNGAGSWPHYFFCSGQAVRNKPLVVGIQNLYNKSANVCAKGKICCMITCQGVIIIDGISRHELKFLISPMEAEILQYKLKNLLPFDPLGENGRYHIDSLYFDDIHNTYLNEKLEGAEKAPKFRIRAYNKNFEKLKLERKQKKGDLVSKKSLPISQEGYEVFLNQSSAYGRQFPELFLSRLLPKVVVSYERTAFVYAPGNVRITLDRYLKTSLTHQPDLRGSFSQRQVFDHEEVVFEVKYTGFLPSYLKGFLNEAQHKQSLSKYALCRLASLT